jgi:hypothetical protein
MTQQGIDNKIKGVMRTLETDALLGKIFDGLGLMMMIDANILSPRQIAKKMSSYSINQSTGRPFTDKELNLMYYGEDLETVYAEYQIPYQDEREYMVNFDNNPVDIRDQVKDKIHEIVRETRKELLSFEISLKNLISNIPRAVAQATTAIVSVVSPQATVPPVPMIISNPSATAQIAGNLHNTALAIRKIVLEATLAIRIFSTLPKLTVGDSFDNNILVPEVKSGSGTNGAKIKRTGKSDTVNQIPKINFLLPEPILNAFYDILSVILDILQIAATIVVALDALAIALELATAAINGSLPTLLAEQAAMFGLQQGIQTTISNLSKMPLGGRKIKTPKNINSTFPTPPSPSTGNSTSAQKMQPGGESDDPGESSQTGAALLNSKTTEAKDSVQQASQTSSQVPPPILYAYSLSKDGEILVGTFSNFVFNENIDVKLDTNKSNLVIDVKRN